MSSEEGRGIVTLRPSTPADGPTIYRIESDPEARRMAAFGGDGSDSPESFQARWERILVEPSSLTRTVLWNEEIVGSVARFELFQRPSVAYWIDRAHWGKGIATRALAALLRESSLRPLYARVAEDNLASRKVLENCGFVVCGDDRGYARFRGVEVRELIYRTGNVD